MYDIRKLLCCFDILLPFGESSIVCMSALLSLFTSFSPSQSPVEHTVSWKIQEYDPLIVRQGETVTFSWEGFHSLHQVISFLRWRISLLLKYVSSNACLSQVDKETYEMCDVVKDPLFIWADPSVDTTVSITNLQPGTYYFLCSIAGHCSAGMKITTIVLPKDGQPTLLNPTVGLCHSLQGCSFVYAEDDTPYVTSVMVICWNNTCTCTCAFTEQCIQ